MKFPSVPVRSPSKLPPVTLTESVFHVLSGRNILWQSELRDGFSSVSQTVNAERVRKQRDRAEARYRISRISNTQIHCG
jgi:hypothetical protein